MEPCPPAVGTYKSLRQGHQRHIECGLVTRTRARPFEYSGTRGGMQLGHFPGLGGQGRMEVGTVLGGGMYKYKEDGDGGEMSEASETIEASGVSETIEASRCRSDACCKLQGRQVHGARRSKRWREDARG
jgi:hypothetical protein